MAMRCEAVLSTSHALNQHVWRLELDMLNVAVDICFLNAKLSGTVILRMANKEMKIR